MAKLQAFLKIFSAHIYCRNIDCLAKPAFYPNTITNKWPNKSLQIANKFSTWLSVFVCKFTDVGIRWGIFHGTERNGNGTLPPEMTKKFSLIISDCISDCINSCIH